MTQQTNPVLHAKNLRVATYDGTEILRGIEFKLYRGEILGLVGESGSGKTTAGLACLAHFREGLQRTTGSMMINPVDGTEPFDLFDLDAETTRSLRGRRIAYIPQDPALSLNPAMRVGEQIMEVLSIHGFGASEAARQQRVDEVLVDVDLPNTEAFQRRWPHQLSGGQQQRIGIAMAFAMNPDVLILDEPTTGLHFEDIRVLLEVLEQLVDKGNTILVIEHNMDVIKMMDHIIDIGYEGGRAGGMVVAKGTPEEVAKDKRSHTAKYLKKELEKNKHKVARAV